MNGYDEMNNGFISLDHYADKELSQKRALNIELIDKQDELIRLMNSVSQKYIKWSIAKDNFISEVVSFSEQISTDVYIGNLSLQEAIDKIEQGISILKKQDNELTSRQVKQVVAVRPVFNANSQGQNGRDSVNVDLFIAGVGFVSGGLQVAAGIGVMSSGAGLIPGMLLTAHGINNLIENGYYLLYRQSYTGPVRLVYEGVGELFGLDTKTSDVIYTLVDVGLSLNSMLGYKLADNAQHLYRHINDDLLWGMKKTGITLMNSGDIMVELIGDGNTIAGQLRSY
ncbi:DUF4225 domain-containing protein [Citrobacter portucalensis]|uniref:DUF4225 domain-containing protein n=1 Tax=Citrobacter portucalensis TaxID=1639133 RepID=A0AAW7LTV1_9ENTR|nr:DUF4225 domain-containing protein [Citrobacter portucalensis]MDN4369188.1 DUF4225 domain-containing protein [Citrobacter portucalensis]